MQRNGTECGKCRTCPVYARRYRLEQQTTNADDTHAHTHRQCQPTHTHTHAHTHKTQHTHIHTGNFTYIYSDGTKRRGVHPQRGPPLPHKHTATALLRQRPCAAACAPQPLPPANLPPHPIRPHCFTPHTLTCRCRKRCC
eukprot:8894-Chlamydomonas_euryale.AAC.2